MPPDRPLKIGELYELFDWEPWRHRGARFGLRILELSQV